MNGKHFLAPTCREVNVICRRVGRKEGNKVCQLRCDTKQTKRWVVIEGSDK